MANNMKLTKAELNQLLSAPLAKGVLKKTNRGQLLKMLDDCNVDLPDASEAEATEVSSDAVLEESYITDEEAKEENDDPCTVAGQSRNPDSTPEILRDKSPEDHALMEASIVAVQTVENEARISTGKEPCLLQDYSASIKDEIVIVTNHVIRSSWHYFPETEICAPAEFLKEGGLKAKSSTSSKKGGHRGHQKSSMRQRVSDLIETAELSAKEICEQIVEEMDRKKSAVVTILNASKSPYWNSLRTGVCIQDDVVMFDDHPDVDLQKASFHKEHPFFLSFDEFTDLMAKAPNQRLRNQYSDDQIGIALPVEKEETEEAVAA